MAQSSLQDAAVTTPGIASIWITRGNYDDDRIYQEYGEDDSKPLLVHWNGQRSGRDDHLVTQGKHITHVFYRARNSAPFTYLGIIDNDTITGPHGEFDHAEKKPATYHFNVIQNENVALARGTVCELTHECQNHAKKWKASAAKALGLQGGNLGSGIVEHQKPVS